MFSCIPVSVIKMTNTGFITTHFMSIKGKPTDGRLEGWCWVRQCLLNSHLQYGAKSFHLFKLWNYCQLIQCDVLLFFYWLPGESFPICLAWLFVPLLHLPLLSHFPFEQLCLFLVGHSSIHWWYRFSSRILILMCLKEERNYCEC